MKTGDNDNSISTILLVEDEVLIRTSIAEYLRHCGYHVIEAGSADDAITLLNNPDITVNILFSDVEMPGSMDGFGLCRWTRENKPDVHVLLTGNVDGAAHAAADLCEQGPHLKKTL